METEMNEILEELRFNLKKLGDSISTLEESLNGEDGEESGMAAEDIISLANAIKKLV